MVSLVTPHCGVPQRDDNHQSSSVANAIHTEDGMSVGRLAWKTCRSEDEIQQILGAA